MNLPFVEKYRPKTIDDIVGNHNIIERFQTIAQEGNMPNIILSGPPGTGKTSSILCLTRQLLGDKMKDAVIELNASDDSGIKVVRNKIKMFVKKQVTLPPGRHKIVILDEADNMTSQAQQALRRLIDNYSSTTRFAFSCNTSSKIINAIQSRCIILRFNKLKEDQMKKRLNYIIQQEGIKYTDEGIQKLISISSGDMREIINNLQTISTYGPLTVDNVEALYDQPSYKQINQLITHTLNNDIKDSLNILKTMYKKGYNSVDILNELLDNVKKYDMDPNIRIEYIKKIGNLQNKMIIGCNSNLQLDGLISKLLIMPKSH